MIPLLSSHLDELLLKKGFPKIFLSISFFQFDIDDLLVRIEIFEMSSGPLNVDFGLYCY